VGHNTIRELSVTTITMADMMTPNIVAAPFLSDRACRLDRSMHPSRLFKKSASFLED
jgi:hypothetical protein